MASAFPLTGPFPDLFRVPTSLAPVGSRPVVFRYSLLDYRPFEETPLFEVLSDALSRRIKDFFTRLRVAREGAFESIFDDRELRLRGYQVGVSRHRRTIGGAEFFRPRPATALRNRPPIGAQLARGGVEEAEFEDLTEND